ncbi:MAG: hypothetical protein IKW74_04850, partial [Thermoguttaceae bacterium]|nr:hypothetical protein [Thermoguttaceae bacterium]
SYHGPLGYYELKEFFAVGAADEDGGNKMIYYNFPLEFNTPIVFGDEKWEIVSRPVENGNRSQIVAGVKVNGPEGGKVAFAIRFPDWAKSVSTDVAGDAKLENGYWILPSVDAGTEIQITFNFVPILEDRRFRTVEAPCLKTGETVEVDECVLRYGPNVLVTKKETSAAIENLNLKIDDDGVIQIPDSLTSIYDMSDTDRDGEHVFVFNVRFSK